MRRSGLARLAFRYASEVVWRRCLGTFLAGDALPDTHLADLHDSFVQPHVREHLVALCDDTEARFDQLARCYPRVTCPVLALWAAEESHFPVAQGQRLAEQVGGQLVVVPQAGHWMVWTHAEAVAEQVRQLGVMRPS
jgi:pimeloyl-ACP methyl ester carboxylesterase